jgi:hypothetical protein
VVSRRLFFLLFILVLPELEGCGGGASGTSTPPVSATPAISSTSPTNVTAGGAAFTITIDGSNFASGATVSWNNPSNPAFIGGAATFVSATRITLSISAVNIAIPGIVQVTVKNPGSSASNSVMFIVNAALPGGAQSISAGVNGAAPNGNSHDPMLSFNGRFIAFSSEATDLVSPNAKFPQGYVRDTCLGTDNCTPATLLFSAVDGGVAASPMEGNAPGGATPSIGAQFFSPLTAGSVLPAGRYVGFLFSATNLVVPGTTFPQAYVRDTCFASISLAPCTPSTVLASITQDGTEPNAAATDMVFGVKSCNVAFVSSATDVLAGVTIPGEIYLASCPLTATSGTLSKFALSMNLVSAATSGVPGDRGAQQPAISADGRLVAFASSSTNLATTPSGGVQQIYLRDTCTGASAGCSPSTSFISLDEFETPFTADSESPAISDDGRYVIFTARVLASGGGAMTTNVYSRDTCSSSSGPIAACTPSTGVVSVGFGAGQVTSSNGPSSSGRHAVSGDGRYVTYSSSATNMVEQTVTGTQIFVRDLCQFSGGRVGGGCIPTTFLVSVDGAGQTGGSNAAISDDGQFVTYEAVINGATQILFASSGF